MATKASDRVTLQVLPTPNNVHLYYLKQASNLAAPAKPTANPPASPWTATEPTYTEGSTDTVYTTMLTVWGDASYQYGDVQKSAAFEAAKQAFNKAIAAGESASSAMSKADQAKADLANLQIGGRNYLPWSNHANKEPGQVIPIDTWGGHAQTGVYDTDVPPGLAGLSEKLTAEKTGTSTGGGYPTQTPRFELVGGETYTYSYWAKKDSEAESVNGYFAALNRVADNRYIGTALVPTLTNEWQRFTQTFTLPEDGGGTYQWRSIIYVSGTYWRSHYKLERGTKATDWAPAPEDTDAKIDGAQTTANGAATVAANLKSAIELGLMRIGKASSPPTVGKGLTWAVLDELTGTKVVGLRIANAAGTAWTPYQIIAEDIMVVGAGGTVRLKNGVVDADTILANEALIQKLATPEFWATLATVENLVVTSKMLGNEIEGKVFKGGLVRGAKVETDALTVGPQVQTETYMTLWESNFNADTTGWAGILGTIARVTTPVYEGAGSLRITYTYPKKMVAAGGLVIPAQVGDVISAWVRTPSAGGYAYIAYYQQHGNEVPRYMGNSKPLPANTWVLLENSVSEPGIIEGLEVVFEDTVGSLVYVDLVQARRPQTSIGAARFTISEGGAALLTAGGKSIVVEDLIDAALRPAPQMGYYQHSAGVANGSAVSGTITFPQPFASPPIVVGTSRSGRLNLQINRATATGFTWFLRNDSGAAAVQADSGFQWIAMN